MDNNKSALPAPGFDEKDLSTLYEEKIEFNRTVLGLSEGVAKNWAKRAVVLFRQNLGVQPGAQLAKS